MARSLIDKLIYSITKKPKHYVEVKHPPKTAIEKLARPQEARQMQYNKWSRRFKVYSGSYLPNDHNDLRKKGWKKKRASDNMHHIYQRKSTNQSVRHDDERIFKDLFDLDIKGYQHQIDVESHKEINYAQTASNVIERVKHKRTAYS